MADPLAIVLELICDERKRQDAKWGEQNHQPLAWLAILTEELGEVAKASLERDFDVYLKELIQVAAVAVATYECAIRGQTRDGAIAFQFAKERDG